MQGRSMPSEATEISGRLHSVMIHKSGNLPFCWYRVVRIQHYSGHEVLIVLFQTLRYVRVCLQCLFPICTIQILEEVFLFAFAVHTLLLTERMDYTYEEY